MNGPNRGKEMGRGWMVTQNGIGLFFLPYDVNLRTFCTRKNIEGDGGIVLDGPKRLRFNETKLCGHVCRSCGKILMEY